MPDQITTVAQLSGYPLGAVFTDIEGGVWMIDSRNPATGACWMLSPETVRMSAKHVLRKWGPLTPVWRPDQAVGSPKVASKPTAKIDDGHTCDAGHFDRTICPEPCGSMHFYCSGCGARQDVCTHDLSVVPGQDLEIPTAEAIAEALTQYETGGLCHFGQTCGLCDCGRAEQTPERQREWDAHQLDRARAVLAVIPTQRCVPSEDGLANVLRDILVRVFEQDKDIVAQDAARAVLALFADQHTVAQVKAEGIREACDHVAGMLARQDADALFSIRVTDLLEVLARQFESGATHG